MKEKFELIITKQKALLAQLPKEKFEIDFANEINSVITEYEDLIEHLLDEEVRVDKDLFEIAEQNNSKLIDEYEMM